MSFPDILKKRNAPSDILKGPNFFENLQDGLALNGAIYHLRKDAELAPFFDSIAAKYGVDF